MLEAHPFLTLVVIMLALVLYGAITDMNQDLFGALLAIAIMVWGAWAISIPDSPEKIERDKIEAIERELRTKEKETPRVLSEVDNCTIYVFERQNREHFFTRCEKTTSTETNWTEGCGKGCSRSMRDSIVTPNK